MLEVGTTELLVIEYTEVEETLDDETGGDDTGLLLGVGLTIEEELDKVELGVGLTTDEELLKETLLLTGIDTVELVLELKTDEDETVSFPH
jgi:hypothetical protein